jgi:transcriptional regulator with XRE-family HTH domain
MRKYVYSPESNILARRLAEMRTSVGVHQKDLATRLGLDQSVISNIERGQRRVDIVEFYRMARALDLDPVEAFKSIAREWDAIGVP